MFKKDKEEKSVLQKKVDSLITHEINFLLNICKKMEFLMARLYEHFSEVFKDDEELYKLWRKMVIEEENHVKHFELAMKVSSDVIENLSIDKRELTERYTKIQEIIDEVRKKMISLDEAIDLAISLEENFEDIHVSMISKFKNPSYKKLFSSMKSCDEAHIEILKQIEKKNKR
ncbi:MAG: hypothetical protein N2202_05385 [Proteobacteria bacterium]|nr:hypothetical protein [Pseudomonadota bacterium]